MIANRFTLKPEQEYVIGRDTSCHICIADQTASRLHATLFANNKQWILQDKDSQLGTYVNDQVIRNQVLQHGDRIQIGTHEFIFDTSKPYCELILRTTGEPVITIPFQSNHAIVGRNTHNLKIRELPRKCFDAHFDETTKKCTLRFPPNLCTVNTRRSQSFALEPGDTLQSNSFDIHFTQHQQLQLHMHVLGMGVSLENINVFKDGKYILNSVSCNIQPGELVGIIGSSGHGKSTLLKTIAGQIHFKGSIVQSPVSFENTPCAFLEQDPPLPEYLTVQESLQMSIALRLPGDLAPQEKSSITQIILEQVNLQDAAHTLCKNLSGGERKRCALGMELVSHPGLLLLDEPGSGLDPENDHKMTMLLKQLTQTGLTILLSTHSFENLAHMDRVLIVQSGYLVWNGTPQDALSYYNAHHFAQILQKLDKKAATVNYQLFCNSPYGSQPKKTVPTEPKQHSHSELRFFPRKKNILFQYLKKTTLQFLRDKGRVSLSWVQPVIIGLLFLLAFKPSSSLWSIAFAFTLSSYWFSLSSSIREIVEERALLRKELQIIPSALPYYLGKLIPVTILATLQSILTLFIFTITLQITPSFTQAMWAILVSCLPATMLGLLTSILAKNTAQAVSALPMLLIPQVIFAGAVVPFDLMPKLGRMLSTLMPARWSFGIFKSIFTQTAFPQYSTISITLFCIFFFIFSVMSLLFLRNSKV
jgi:ABC transport system ATP-binding/permease protein